MRYVTPARISNRREVQEPMSAGVRDGVAGRVLSRHRVGAYFTTTVPCIPAWRWPGIRQAYSKVPALVNFQRISPEL